MGDGIPILSRELHANIYSGGVLWVVIFELWVYTVIINLALRVGDGDVMPIIGL